VVYAAPPVGIPQGTCYRERMGNIIGGAAGGYLGSQVGSGSGQKAATAAGAVLGWIIGGEIGRSMDNVDQACAGQALEQAEESQPVRWADGGNQYRVVPTRTYQRDGGQYCREYTAEGTIGGRVQTV
jgi:surface antigen